MKNRLIIMLFAAVMVMLAITACNGRKHDAAYYEQMIDSIRKAEQVKEMQKQAGIVTNVNPALAWFDSLELRTLPVRNAGDDLERLGQFRKVPMLLNENFNYAVSAKLRAIQMPRAYRRNVIMLAEMRDSITPDIYLYIMDKNYQPLDRLLIYEKREEQEENDFGVTFTEYFITSNYDITLMRYYQSHKPDEEAVLLDSRRYIINKEGRFEEAIIEL